MSDQPRRSGFSTLAIHAGTTPDPNTKALITPIHQTGVFESADHAAPLLGSQAFGGIDSRFDNQTFAVLEERIAALEGGTAALAVASGHGGQLLAFQTLLGPGDEFIASRRLHGGLIKRFDHAFRSFGWAVRWADPDDAGSFAAAVSERTKAVFIESIANPGGAITDIEAVAKVARDARLPLIVDNTLATPYLVRPFEHGADIVLHSATKFLGGHGSLIGGLIVDGGTFDWVDDDRYPILSKPCASYGDLVLAETFGNFSFAMACRALGLCDLGPALSPFNALLILTGIETLPLRMRRHCESALAVADHLVRHPAVHWVRYAGLPSDPCHALAQRYARNGAGAVFTFGVAGGYEAGVALVRKLRLFSHGVSVGETRSLVIHPASMSPRQIEDGDTAGAGPDLIRLSIGLEDKEDIIADLDQALAV